MPLVYNNKFDLYDNAIVSKEILVAVDQSNTTPSTINAAFDVANGDGELKEEIEDMMRIELRDMIKNKASQQEIDAKIAAIDAKLTGAYAKVSNSHLVQH